MPKSSTGQPSNGPALPVPNGFIFKKSVPVRDLTIAMNHHVVVVGGEVRYRIWSESARLYVTRPMTREQYRESRLMNALVRGGFSAMIQELETGAFLHLTDWVSDEGVSPDKRADLLTWDRQGRQPLSAGAQLEMAHRLASLARAALMNSEVWSEVAATCG